MLSLVREYIIYHNEVSRPSGSAKHQKHGTGRTLRIDAADSIPLLQGYTPGPLLS